jgi:glycosyltransferase involved in cell wall biosynthesis
MKIVQLITRLIVGGAQRIALETAAGLRARSIDAEIWCGTQTGPEGSLFDEAAARGIPVRSVPGLIKEVDPVRDLSALRWLIRELRERRPAVIHTHSSKAGILGRRAARTAGIEKIFHTVHGWGFSDETPRIARRCFITAERAASHWVDSLIAVSANVRDTGLRHGIGRPDLYEVIRPGVDPAPFADLDRLRRRGSAVREALGIRRDALVVGTVGRLSPQKNPGMILDAAASFPEIHWLLVGDGPLRGEIEARIRRESLSERVHLAGLQTDTASYFGALDLFVLVSLWEGLPLTLIEAAMSGLPSVAAQVGGVAELLARPPAGCHFMPGDGEGFRQAVHDWQRNKAESRAAALANRDTVLSACSRERMLERILSLYESNGGNPA